MKIGFELFKNAGTEKQKVCYVYFVIDKTQNAVKIGHSTNVQGRFKAIESLNLNNIAIAYTIPFSTSVKAREIEKAFHLRYKDSQIRDEWFRYNLKVKEDIETISQAQKLKIDIKL